jgi:hypothetical protein
MARTLLGVMLCAAALGGCAPSLGRPDAAPSSSSAVGSSTPGAGNVFAPEPNHYFGSGGP